MITSASNVMRSILFTSLAFSGSVNAKSIKNKFGKTQGGRMQQTTLTQISNTVEHTLTNIDQSRYEDIVANPEAARSDEEKLAALSAREIFILVDRSGSMNAPDDNPTGAYKSGWNRWQSANVASQSISELALALDTDNVVDIMFWSGDMRGKLEKIEGTMKYPGEIDNFFKKHPPQRGSTPLADALDDVYKNRLKSLLQRSEPFTVIILTDGQPNNPNAVKSFFKKVVRENNLEQPGRETLAAFSFVRMGDDAGAIQFLNDLDDNLINQTGINVDIVDTKPDNFLFGTAEFSGREGVGPFALLWDAIYD